MTLKKREVCEKHISLFNFGTATIRVIPDFKDGQPYFVAKDVAEVLGFGRVDVANRICLARLVVKRAEVPTEKVETLFDSKTTSMLMKFTVDQGMIGRSEDP
ncbi:Bro-N domain-containing protein [Shewanella algae]|uniref:Bro-N domain-containing protein n=2 Tax=Shewanellaceae TaxID=267890 RepID=UPI001AAFB468|nr:Bro-N domain-containing protein [Shewanella algae]MBO2587196.1 Bro-N domain-containing protein [Shewanella algae]